MHLLMLRGPCGARRETLVRFMPDIFPNHSEIPHNIIGHWANYCAWEINLASFIARTDKSRVSVNDINWTGRAKAFWLPDGKPKPDGMAFLPLASSAK